MITLIIGGSGSGKSAYAEKYIGALSGECPKYYIATMQVFDREGEKKVQRHRSMRSGKGFLTIEQPVRIEEAAQRLEKERWKSCDALLECMSNLTANEMFAEEIPQGCEAVAERILAGIAKLSDGFRNLVIVSNNVFEDGTVYDETTTEYIRAMGTVNQKLAELADRVIEIVAGIPVILKEEN